MLTEPTCDEGKLWVIFECLEHRGSRRSERKCALVDQKGVLFVNMGIRLTEPSGILCKCTECFVVNVTSLVDWRQRTGHG